MNESEQKNTWSPAEAAEWAGIPIRTFYKILNQRLAPAIEMGDEQHQKLASSHNGKRNRSCYRYLIPRVAFIRWWENIQPPQPELRKKRVRTR